MAGDSYVSRAEYPSVVHRPTLSAFADSHSLGDENVQVIYKHRSSSCSYVFLIIPLMSRYLSAQQGASVSQAVSFQGEARPATSMAVPCFSRLGESALSAADGAA